MPKCYQLVGVPASGKSTWIKDQIWALDLNIVSTDVWVEDYAKRMGKTYSEVFTEYMPIAVKLMADHVVKCRENNHDIIWDQTSTTVASRRRKFRMLPDYEHIAVVFGTPPTDELVSRLAGRAGKDVPWEVVQGMIDNFEMPTEDEGFIEIWRV